jgi:predicted dehydrogenase
MGCIGVGGQGTGDMNAFLNSGQIQVVAVCDPERAHRDRARQIVNDKQGNSECVAYNDFRDLLEHRGINAVTVCTPDHWHALASVAAANAGMDIYCEKPLANSVGEGRAIVDAVRKNKVILQTGSQERSNPRARFACEAVRNGRIGRLHTIRINLPCSDGHHHRVLEENRKEHPPEPVREGFDYNLWLGHTAEVPYTPMRCHFWWRFILSYGGGEMTDRGAHIIDLAQLGNGTDDTTPIEIEAKGSCSDTGLYNAFMDYHFENRYANGVRMIGANEGPRGLKFEGDDGWIFVHIHGANLEASDPALTDQATASRHKIDLGRSPGHHQNFLDCVRSRKSPLASAEIGHHTATICHLNNIAMLTGRKLKWDPANERIIGDDEASRLLTPKMRPPWHL